MKVVLASKNPHKLVEISSITEKFGMELILQSQLGVDIEVEETGTTFEENSLLKAKAVMEATGLPAIADDSGIAVDALNGEPGIYSARYGFDDSLDDWGRLLLLLKNMEQVPDGQRQAKFVCVITFMTPDGQVIQAKQFKEIAGVTAIALTKLDGTAKGGIVIAVADALQIPVKFVGVGEKAEDLMPFSALSLLASLIGAVARSWRISAIFSTQSAATLFAPTIMQ